MPLAEALGGLHQLPLMMLATETEGDEHSGNAAALAKRPGFAVIVDFLEGGPPGRSLPGGLELQKGQWLVCMENRRVTPKTNCAHEMGVARYSPLGSLTCPGWVPKIRLLGQAR